MYNTSKESRVQGLDFIFLHLELWAIYGDVMTQKLKKKLTFLFVTVSFLLIESSVIPALKAFMEGFISSSYTDELWAIYEDIMT